MLLIMGYNMVEQT